MKTTLTPRKRVSLYFSLFLLAGFVALQGVSEAQILEPELNTLAPLTDRIEHPSDVALDRQGNAYIAETTRHRVTVLTQSGQYTGKTLSVFEPISVAIDNNGRILVGSARDGSVSIFGADLRFVRKLGSGAGEFGKPVDIAISAAGNIYVADKTNHAINIYNGNGNKTSSIGTPGNGDGQLHHPTSIAINENASEIVVLDHQQILDERTGNMIDGTRIQYFDLTGVSLRSYSKFGYNNAGFVVDPTAPMGFRTAYDITMGQMVMAKQVAVDSMGRIYVTAARWNKVMIYDNYDNFLGTIDVGSSPLRIPNGITIGASNRLYVASQFTKKVEVFGVDTYTAMVTTPSAIEFRAVENGNAPPAQIATITNSGNASFTWTSSSSDSWISLATSANPRTLLPTDEPAELNIAVNPDGFAPGEHTGSIIIDTGAGAAEVINVVLTIEPNPLQVAGDATFTATTGSTPTAQELVVTSATEDALLWNVSADQPWISLNKSTGMTPDTLRVYADISSLNPGSYDGTITFVQQGDDPAPVEVPVSLTLTEHTASENPPGFDNEGKQKWNKKWTVSRVIPGTSLNGVSGTSNADVFAVGDDGTILHLDGKNWTQMGSGATTTLNSVWSDTESNAYAVGAEGMVLNFNGNVWTHAATTGANALQDIWGNSSSNIVTADEYGSILDSSFTSSSELGVALRTVWGSDDNNVFAAGEGGAIFRFDGNNWLSMNSKTTEWINGIWGSSSSNVFAVGENGTVVHYDGKEWKTLVSGTAKTLNGVCGTSANDVYVVGDDSLILNYNGSEWSSLNAGAEANLNDIWCAGSDIFAVGDDGTIIHGQGKNFPWLRVIITITDNARRAKEKEKEELNKQ